MFPCRRSMNMPLWIFPACLIVIFLNSETHEFVFAIFSSNGGRLSFCPCLVRRVALACV